MQRILIVDNDPLLLRALSDHLEKRGYQVSTAADGLTALTLLHAATPDILFLDWVMPGLSGERLCRIVRSLPALESVPIVILSAIAAESAHDYRACGANACIAKGPFDNLAENVLTAIAQLQNNPLDPLPTAVQGIDKLHPRQVTNVLLSYKHRLDVVLSGMSDGVIELTPAGQILSANPAAAAMAGIPEERLLGMHFIDLADPQEHPIIGPMLTAAERKPQSTPPNAPVTLNGTQVLLDIFFISDRGNPRLIVLLNDVSEKKRVEKVLRRQNEYLYALHETSLGLLNRLDMNELLQAIIERSAQLADTDHGFVYLLDPQDGKMELRMGKGFFENVINLKVELGQGLGGKVWQDGRLLWIKNYASWHGRLPYKTLDAIGSVVGIPLFSGRDIIGVIGMAHLDDRSFSQEDISVLERLAELASIALDNARLYGDIRRKLAEHEAADRDKKRLEAQLLHAQKMEAIGTLAGGVAHDFNNILQAITGYSELLLLKSDPVDPDHKDLQAIKEAAQRASHLVRQLLVFSRKMENKYEAIDLNEVIIRIAKMLERTIPRMIKIEMVLENRLELISADVTQVEQVLMNLGVNARDAMPDGGTITIKTANAVLDEAFCKSHLGAQPGTYVLMVVSDTGHGMEKEVLDHIFEPFFTTKQRDKGTGLGLATLYGIVKSHRGFIYCSSTPGSGTSFEIYFPALPTQAVTPLKPSVETRQLPRGTETILVVDDEVAILDLAQEILENHGYSILLAKSGEEAIETYRNHRHRVDLVILDVGMPGMGGYKCLEELAKINPAIKTIISSGYSATGKVKAALQTGAADFIGKPYTLAGLLHKVREILDSDSHTKPLDKVDPES